MILKTRFVIVFSDNVNDIRRKHSDLAKYFSIIMSKYKHKHGTPNPIIQQEEKAILLAVDRALCSSTNSQIIGRNGEIPLLEFLNRYLPPTLRAATGHFVTPTGNISSQLDIMILDSRYPLLSQNTDGSVLVMLHSLLEVIEVKTNLSTKDIKKSWLFRILRSKFNI